MTRYVGILDGADDIWGVRIPDVPGCHGGGDTPEAAVADCLSALRQFAEDGLARGIPMPQARRMAEVRSDPDADFRPQEGEALVMLPLIVETGRPARASIALDEGVLAAIDEAAQAQGLSRSDFLVSAAREKILDGA